MSNDHLAIKLVNFFREKYLLAVIPARLHCVQGKHLHDEKLKLNELGPYVAKQLTALFHTQPPFSSLGCQSVAPTINCVF